MFSLTWFFAVLSALLVLLLPGTLTYISLSRFDIIPNLPLWGVLLSSLLALPVFLIGRRLFTDLNERRQAKRLGAAVPPMVFDPSFTGIFTFLNMVKQAEGYTASVFDMWNKMYGNTIQFQSLGGYSRIFTTEPEYIKAILATQFNEFSLGPGRYDAFFPLLGTGVFNSDGDLWKMHRSATRPYFSKDRISHLDNFDQHAEMAITLAKRRLTEGHPIDFQDLVARFTLDSATQFLFGNDVQSLNAGLPYSETSGIPNSTEFNTHASNSFAHSFLEAQLLTASRARKGSLAPLLEPHGEQISPLKKAIEPYINTIIEQVVEKRKELGDLKKDDDDDSSLLEHLLDFMDDPTALRDEVINLLVAGRDTTASLLTFSVYALTQHPGILKRLRQEVIDLVGPSARPTIEKIKELKYLRAFLNETLRLYPVVPINGREAVCETVLKSKNPDVPPLYVPNGKRVTYSVFLMQRRTDLWGPDALTFDPDRFLDWRVSKYLVPNPYIFTPFNAGPRICLGQGFAYNEASFFLIKLLQSFDRFELAEHAMPLSARPPESWKDAEGRQAEEKIIPVVHLTMAVKGGLWVSMHPVNADDQAPL